MIAGLATTLPNAIVKGLTAHGVSLAQAHAAGATPPVGNLFAAFLGYNPILALLKGVGVNPSSLSPANLSALTGKTFFPQLISGPFHSGLIIVFVTAAVLSVIGAAASILAGGKYMHVDTARVSTSTSGTGSSDSPVEAELSDV